MTPYYQDDACTIYHGDCREIVDEGFGVGECVIADPPWDNPSLFGWLNETIASEFDSLLVFSDARRIGEPLTVFGVPAWLFVWDTMNTWSMSKGQPVQQTKLCLWYGENYERDAELWGDAPPTRDHPTTKQTPLHGRRLTDLYRESLRWLHNPSAGLGSAGVERFGERQGNPALRHAKPVGWMRCLIGNNNVRSRGFVAPDGWPYCADGRVTVDHGFRHLGQQADSTPCIKLDTLCPSTKIDAITIDVEGAELRVLAGATQILDRDRPLVWVSAHIDYQWNDEVYEGMRPTDLVRFMDRAGYDGELLAVDHEEHWFFTPREERHDGL